MNKRLVAATVGLCALVAGARSAPCALIYVSDYQGNVAKYETTMGSLTAVGNLNGFTIGKVMGLAYDGSTNSLLLLDRNGRMAYSMNAQTGTAAQLFSLSRPFQGGAVRGGLLYGIDEALGTMSAYSLSDHSLYSLSGNVAPAHTHAIGVDALSGQLYSMANGSIRTISDDGVFGAPVLTTQASFLNDLDYYDGDFVGVIQGRGIDIIDGGSGQLTSLVTRGQLEGLGLDMSIAGQGVAVVVPEPSTYALWIILIMTIWSLRKRFNLHKKPRA